MFDQARIGLLEATLAGFEESLHHQMPAGPQKDYWLWGISEANPDQRGFIQAIGLRQIVNLTTTLLDGLVDAHLWPLLNRYLAYLIVYQLYEVVSDNLALGLVRVGNDEQRRLLMAFNEAMIERLHGGDTPPQQLLEPLRLSTVSFSCFGQSLIRETHLRHACAYINTHPNVALNTLEYGLWPLLVANIEACAVIAAVVDGCATSSLVREGLINRYRAVNYSLAAQHMSLMELANLGAHAILAVPSLGYCVAVLAELVCPNDRYRLVLEDGSLIEVLYSAALLTRLLNDLGSDLLHQTETQRHLMLRAMLTTYKQNPHTLNTISLLLLSLVDGDNLLTRIHKDLFYGEFNICLYNLRNIQSVEDAIEVFGKNLVYFARLYAEHHARLDDGLNTIAQRLGDDRFGTLIRRFVDFHAQLYSNRYTAVEGEFAI